MSTTESAVPVPQLFAAPVVQTGTFEYGYIKDKNDWKLNSGKGERTFRAKIAFSHPFSSPPKLMIALTGLDADKNANTRIEVLSAGVTNQGFEIVARTWWDSVIYGVWGTWIALGS